MELFLRNCLMKEGKTRGTTPSVFMEIASWWLLSYSKQILNTHATLSKRPMTKPRGQGRRARMPDIRAFFYSIFEYLRTHSFLCELGLIRNRSLLYYKWSEFTLRFFVSHYTRSPDGNRLGVKSVYCFPDQSIFWSCSWMKTEAAPAFVKRIFFNVMLPNKECIFKGDPLSSF